MQQLGPKEVIAMQERSCQECAFHSTDSNFCAVNPIYCADPMGDCLDFEQSPVVEAARKEKARREQVRVLGLSYRRLFNEEMEKARDATARGDYAVARQHSSEASTVLFLAARIFLTLV